MFQEISSTYFVWGSQSAYCLCQMEIGAQCLVESALAVQSSAGKWNWAV